MTSIFSTRPCHPIRVWHSPTTNGPAQRTRLVRAILCMTQMHRCKPDKTTMISTRSWQSEFPTHMAWLSSHRRFQVARQKLPTRIAGEVQKLETEELRVYLAVSTRPGCSCMARGALGANLSIGTLWPWRTNVTIHAGEARLALGACRTLRTPRTNLPGF